MRSLLFKILLIIILSITMSVLAYTVKQSCLISNALAFEMKDLNDNLINEIKGQNSVKNDTVITNEILQKLKIQDSLYVASTSQFYKYHPYLDPVNLFKMEDLHNSLLKLKVDLPAQDQPKQNGKYSAYLKYNRSQKDYDITYLFYIDDRSNIYQKTGDKYVAIDSTKISIIDTFYLKNPVTGEYSSINYMDPNFNFEINE